MIENLQVQHPTCRKLRRPDDSEYRAIVETIREGVIGIDENGVIHYCNPGFIEMLHSGGLGPPPMTIFECLGRDEEAKFRRFLGAARRGRGAREKFRLVPAGSAPARLVEFSASIDRDEADEESVAEYFLVVTDLTESVLNLDLATERRRLQEQNEELDRFASSAAHDLNEPLQKILAFADLLRLRLGPKLVDREATYLERLVKSARRMSHLIDSLLFLARANHTEPPLESIPLEKIIRHVVFDLEAAIAAANAEVTWTELPVVRGSEPLLRQLFQNLVSNAVKYRRKSAPPRVTIQGRPISREWVEISVADNGVGFGIEDTERIFRPFCRLESTLGREGTGIGLATCQRIVSRHGGRITARGIPGLGATFSLTLPLARCAGEGGATGPCRS